MIIRNQINHLTKYIQECLPNWDRAGAIYVETESNVLIISILCKEILNKLIKYDASEKSLLGRTETLQNLSTALRDLAHRISPARNLFQKILTYFGFCLTESEKILWETIRKVECCRDKLTPCFLVRWKWSFDDWFTAYVLQRGISSTEQSASYRFKECAFRTMQDPGRYRIDPRLEGAPAFLALKNILKDLEQFSKEHEKDLTIIETKILTEIASQLKAAEPIAFENSLNQKLKLCGFSEYQLATNTANRAYKIEKQVEGLEVGQSVILPGGYVDLQSKLGHAVVFEIQRIESEKFQFVIYNTAHRTEHDQIFSGFSELIFPKTFHPVAFQNLSKDAVADQEFLIQLLNFEIDASFIRDPMDELYYTIKNHCIRHGGVQVLLEKQLLQSWGTCAFSSVMSYLQAKLRPDLYSSLESYMAKKAREELNHLIPLVRKSKAFNEETINLIDFVSRQAIGQQAVAA